MEKLSTILLSPDERRRINIILLIALLNGLLYIALVPPWQHYDEPGHFEYVWLIADQEKSLTQNPSTRREIAASMVEHGFFRGMDFTPNLLAKNEPVWIGPTQIESDPPLYYSLVALPLRCFHFTDITFQLYTARIVSLLLYIVSVWVAARIMTEWVKEDNVLRWAVPSMMALLPAYTDLMTAVNNDVGAVVIFSLFLWGAERTIQRGLSVLRLIWLIGTAILCVWTKDTAAIAVLLLPIAIILTICRQSCSWVIRLGSIVAGFILLTTLIKWGDAAFWYRQTNQEPPTRQERMDAPLGEAVIAIEAAPSFPESRVAQPLPDADVKSLRGKIVTVGAWIWASEPFQMRSPMLDDGYHITWEPVKVQIAPTFYAFTATISPKAKQIWVVLQPAINKTSTPTVTVWYDGIVLIDGIRPIGRLPVFEDASGQIGWWGEHIFDNRVRNSSAEISWPRLKDWPIRKLKTIIHYSLPISAHNLVWILDWQFARRLYKTILINLFQSFWARFGWNHIGLTIRWYWLLLGWTIIGLIGAAINAKRFLKERNHPVKQTTTFTAIATLTIWTLCFLRAEPFRPFIPSARYAYPAIIPTVTVLMGGWLAWVPQRAKKLSALSLLFGMVVLDYISLITIWRFYGR